VHVAVDTVARDPAAGIKRPLAGRIGVLLEKWPGDEFWVATPTRLPEAQFVVAKPRGVAEALARVLQDFALEHDLESLEPFAAADDEYVTVLDVDVYPQPAAARARREVSARPAKRSAETGLEREERRAAPASSPPRCGRWRATSRTRPRTTPWTRALGREGLGARAGRGAGQPRGLALVVVGPSGGGQDGPRSRGDPPVAEHSRSSGQRRDVWRLDGAASSPA
jgi:ATP-dependent Clp protease ATP-binding subunit ClpC